MARLSLSKLLLAGGVLVASAFVAGAGAQSSSPPDLSGGEGGWVHDGGATFPPVKGSPSPVVQDPAHPFISQAASWRIGDLSNPILKDWVKQVMKKDNDEIHAGKIAFQARSSCVPSGVPNIFLPGNGLQIVQTRDKIVMFKQGNWEYRHIYLDVPHSRERQTVLVRRIGRPLGGRHARRRHDRPESQDLRRCVPHAPQREPARRRALASHRRRQDLGSEDHRRRSGRVQRALVDLCAPRARTVSDGRGHLRGEQPEPLRLQDAGRRDTGFLRRRIVSAHLRRIAGSEPKLQFRSRKHAVKARYCPSKADGPHP